MYRLVEWRTDSKGILGTVITENISIVNELDSKQIKEVRYVEDEFPMRFKGEGIKGIPQVENKYLLVYIGKDVYIGVLGIDGVDYKNLLLLDRGNKKRLAYVWEQIAVDENEMLSTNVKLEF